MTTHDADPRTTTHSLEEALHILEAGGGDAAVRERFLHALRAGHEEHDEGYGEHDDHRYGDDRYGGHRSSDDGPGSGQGRPRSGRWAEVGAYVGATLVIAAGVVFVGSVQAELGRSGVGACVLATSLLLGLVSVAAQAGGGAGEDSTDRQQARRRLAGIAGYAAVLGLGVGAGLVSARGAAAATLTGAGVVAAGALVRARSLPWTSPSAQVWGMGAGGVVIASAAVLYDDPRGALLGGVGACTLGAAWLVWGWRPGNDEPQLASALGLVTAIVGAEVTVADQPLVGYVLLALVAATGLGIDSRRGSTVALGLAVAATTLVVTQAVSHYTHGSLGAAGALLVGGFALLGASGLGAGLRRRRTDQHVR